MNEINSPILSIPGINYRMGVIIVAKISDFSRFDSPDKILAYAGLLPSTYQSRQLDSCHSHMEKQGSHYLRFTLFNTIKYVCPLGTDFRFIFSKETSRRQALQCCHIPCCKDALCHAGF